MASWAWVRARLRWRGEQLRGLGMAEAECQPPQWEGGSEEPRHNDCCCHLNSLIEDRCSLLLGNNLVSGFCPMKFLLSCVGLCFAYAGLSFGICRAVLGSCRAVFGSCRACLPSGWVLGGGVANAIGRPYKPYKLYVFRVVFFKKHLLN